LRLADELRQRTQAVGRYVFLSQRFRQQLAPRRAAERGQQLRTAALHPFHAEIVARIELCAAGVHDAQDRIVRREGSRRERAECD
jgi:hypothetical protein